ncbi:CASP-like protein 1E1 isoform X1 [Dendrobium catenatum]|uniref:CASP-like protein 1E1 isoform X1 n=1 Tax=Dendrobium catenatum TaxID=906689 RepID=UPI0009F37361|nr:CASP-like protein 1E1 isoform X1 [Dendrobium catenatum]
MDYQLKAGSEFSSVDPPVVAPPPTRRLHIDGVDGLPPSRAMEITGNVLRGVAAVLTFVAAIVMGTAAQTKRVVVIDDSGSPVTLAGTAKSHYSSALVYFIVINVLTLVYSLATIILYHASKKAAMAGIYLPLTITDLLTMIFLVSCNGAASAISVVAENGNRHFGWDKICVSVRQYCAQIRRGSGCARTHSALVRYKFENSDESCLSDDATERKGGVIIYLFC